MYIQKHSIVYTRIRFKYNEFLQIFIKFYANTQYLLINFRVPMILVRIDAYIYIFILYESHNSIVPVNIFGKYLTDESLSKTNAFEYKIVIILIYLCGTLWCVSACIRYCVVRVFLFSLMIL